MFSYLPQPRPRVISIASGGTGQGWDITDEIDDLSWSSVNPGGDERCNFTLKRSWFSDNPEVERGNLLRVQVGVDVVWQGRVEETDRSGGDTEQIAVTAYGLGARLKDGSFQEIFMDRDLSAWGEPSTQRRISLGSSIRFEGALSTGAQDSGAAGPGLVFTYNTFDSSTTERGEAWYYGGGVDIGEVRTDVTRLVGEADDVNWVTLIRISPDDLRTTSDDSADLNYGNSTNNSVSASTTGRKYVMVSADYAGPSTGTVKRELAFVYLRVLGNHDITPQGSQPEEGFTLDQMVRYIVEDVPGVQIRRLDEQTYVIQQAAFKDPVPHESAIDELNKLEGCDWGTWGPDSPLDLSTNGQFDLKDREPDVQHWTANRADCSDLALHSETATLYGAVDVTYEDGAGVRRTVRREVNVPDLDSAGLTRVYQLDIGKSTKAVAEARGDVFLAIWGQFAPARGSFSISVPLTHYLRGDLSPLYLRADGSNLRIPDILPSTSAFALDDTPDRRTTFPIKRVEIDCAGEVPQARVEVDQANDTLSILQAREDLESALVG